MLASDGAMTPECDRFGYIQRSMFWPVAQSCPARIWLDTVGICSSAPPWMIRIGVATGVVKFAGSCAAISGPHTGLLNGL